MQWGSIEIEINLKLGNDAFKCYNCDFTHDYIDINADYRNQMIKYNLKCHKNHEFESWFSNSMEFDNLNKKGLLECIYCSSKRIEKSIMAPMLSTLKKNENEKIKETYKNLKDNRKKLLQLRKYIESNFDYVGEFQ